MPGSASASIPELNTVGVIAKRSRAALHQVEYVIESRGITPVGRAGNARVFSEHDVVYIQSELRRIAEERGGLA